MHHWRALILTLAKNPFSRSILPYKCDKCGSEPFAKKRALWLPTTIRYVYDLKIFKIPNTAELSTLFGKLDILNQEPPEPNMVRRLFKNPLITETTSDVKQVCPSPCIFYEQCASHETWLSKDPISEAYDGKIKVTITERSSSLVVRSEQLFHGSDFNRLSLRKHIYEVIPGGSSSRSFGLACEEFSDHDMLGKYVGYVDFRVYYQGSPIAFAILVPPSRIRDDPFTYTIEGQYSTIFGGENIDSSVYAMQDPQCAGAKCAQVCIMMVLGFLSDRHAFLRGSFAISCLAQLGLEKINDSSTHTFRIGGLDLETISDVLKKCNVSSKSVTINHMSGILAIEIIEAYVLARFPVIVCVNTTKWYSEKGIDAEDGHSVVVVGARIPRDGAVSDAFYVHDPGERPFARIDHNQFLEKTLISRKNKTTGTERNVYSFSLAADRGVKCHLPECIQILGTDQKLKAIKSRIKRRFPGVALLQKYRLLNGAAIPHILFGAIEGSDQLTQIPQGRFWTITNYDPTGSPLATLLFNAYSTSAGCVGLIWNSEWNGLSYIHNSEFSDWINNA